MAGKIITPEEKDIIIELFEAKHPISYIAEKVGCSDQTIRNILDREGLKPINYGSKNGAGVKHKEKKCPHCKAVNHNKGARFCWKCGGDIRSEAIILNERVAKLLSFCAVYAR